MEKERSTLRSCGFKAGNAYAERTIRRLELEWMDYSNQSMCYKQVRQLCGGGVRHLTVEKTLSLKAVLNHALDAFFPSGVSQRGILQEFELELKDFQCMCVNMEKTINELYIESKLKIFRVYLYSKKKTEKVGEEVHTATNKPSSTVKEVALEVQNVTTAPIAVRDATLLASNECMSSSDELDQHTVVSLPDLQDWSPPSSGIQCESHRSETLQAFRQENCSDDIELGTPTVVTNRQTYMEACGAADTAHIEVIDIPAPQRRQFSLRRVSPAATVIYSESADMSGSINNHSIESDAVTVEDQSSNQTNDAMSAEEYFGQDDIHNKEEKDSSLLKKWVDKALQPSEPQTIVVQRERLLQTTLRVVGYSTFNWSQPLRIVFSGEDDQRGPKIEYLWCNTLLHVAAPSAPSNFISFIKNVWK
ncbi:uncharacterized protein LOC123524937 [Mercenaria mercenaria]|uniref:uncharacterized protein LOC123524937 n=1 Tax=Mercenaria mercenaria TaxID=6596 RepID=UPI00234FA025|nr:uncharacterized protein LOC123524937 [Mercenaria mercenaria]